MTTKNIAKILGTHCYEKTTNFGLVSNSNQMPFTTRTGFTKMNNQNISNYDCMSPMMQVAMLNSAGDCVTE